MRFDPLARRIIGSLSLGYKVRQRWNRRRDTSRYLEERRSKFYESVWGEAAASVGVSWSRLNGSLFEIRCGAFPLRVVDNITSLDDPVTLRIAGDKPIVYRLLHERNIPVPKHLLCRSDELAKAWDFMVGLQEPCVVKPARRTGGGAGVTTGITGRWTLAKAMAWAGAFGREIVIEEQIRGENYRLLYFDGELLDAVRRLPPTVVGDGRSSIRQLIAKENRDRIRTGIEASLSLIEIDIELMNTLWKRRYRLRCVPPKGETVQVKHVVNDNRREDNESATERLCPSVIEAGSNASKAIGARLAGVDLITRNPERPLRESGGAIIEVNTTPGFHCHYMKSSGGTPVACMILQGLANKNS